MGLLRPVQLVSFFDRYMNNGWIKIHRGLQDKGYYTDSHYVHLWIHLLMKANHEEKEFLWNGRIIKIKRGQMIAGRKKLSKETGINEHKVDRILKTLEFEQQITQQATNKYRLITILNYSKYQDDNREVEQQVSNKRATSEHKQELKNYKKDTIQTDKPFVWEKYLEDMMNDNNPAVRLIAVYFNINKLKFDSLKEVQIAIKRHIRSANQVKEFSKEKIIKAIQECKQQYEPKGIKWTFETLIKQLTK